MLPWTHASGRRPHRGQGPVADVGPQGPRAGCRVGARLAGSFVCEWTQLPRVFPGAGSFLGTVLAGRFAGSLRSVPCARHVWQRSPESASARPRLLLMCLAGGGWLRDTCLLRGFVGAGLVSWGRFAGSLRSVPCARHVWQRSPESAGRLDGPASGSGRLRELRVRPAGAHATEAAEDAGPDGRGGEGLTFFDLPGGRLLGTSAHVVPGLEVRTGTSRGPGHLGSGFGPASTFLLCLTPP